MNKQEFIINTLKPYFLDKSLRAQVGQGRCKYRTPDGRKCAVGQYIPDDKYTLSLEESTISVVLKYLNEYAQNQNLSETEWLAIQAVHDYMSPLYVEDCEQICQVDLTELKELASLTNT